MPRCRTLLFGLLLLWLAHTQAAAATLTFIDLNPPTATRSVGMGVDDTGQVGSAYFGSFQHAALWLGTPDSFTDLNPYGADHSRGLAGGGLYQAGSATYTNPPAYTHAAFWTGSSGSYQDFDPGLNNLGSSINAVSGTQQGGAYSLVVNGKIALRPVLWSSAAGSYVDLTPSGLIAGVVYGIDDTQQVGSETVSGYGQAALWSGTPDSFVDLHPAIASSSIAYAVSGSQQAGAAQVGGVSRAALWSGTAASYTDLTPAAASAGAARAASGTKQAGYVTINGLNHAALWSGSAASFVDLQAALGSLYTNSAANAVWSDGITTYVVGQAHPVSSAGSVTHAILWTYIEPPRPPPLQITSTRSGTVNVTTITWTNNGVSSQLQSSDSATGVWNTVSAPAVTNGNWISAVISNTAASQFFRLQGN